MNYPFFVGFSKFFILVVVLIFVAVLLSDDVINLYHGSITNESPT